MEHQKLLLMVIVFILGLSSLTNGYPFKPSTGQCEVQPKARVNCGYPYISAQECNKRGCCYNSEIAGVIWCFFPADTKGLVKPVQQVPEPQQVPPVPRYEQPRISCELEVSL